MAKKKKSSRENFDGRQPVISITKLRPSATQITFASREIRFVSDFPGKLNFKQERVRLNDLIHRERRGLWEIFLLFGERPRTDSFFFPLFLFEWGEGRGRVPSVFGEPMKISNSELLGTATPLSRIQWFKFFVLIKFPRSSISASKPVRLYRGDRSTKKKNFFFVFSGFRSRFYFLFNRKNCLFFFIY